MRQKLGRVLFVLTTALALLAVVMPANGQQERRELAVFGQRNRVPLMPLAPDKGDHTKWQGADKLVESLARHINSQPVGAPPCRIAVFPFGRKQAPNQEGEKKLDPQQAFKALAIQATLISTIRQRLIEQKLDRTFMLMDKFALARTFGDSAIDPTSISPDNDELPKLLRDLKIDAAVVGEYDENGAVGIGEFQGFGGDWERVAIQGKLVLGGMKPSVTPISATPVLPDFNGTDTDLNVPRFGVSLSARPGEGSDWQSIPLVVDKNDFFQGQIYALVPKHLQNAEYRIRVGCNSIRKERGLQKFEDFPGNIVNVSAQEDENRLFGVAVLVDGVNSIHENIGEGTGALVVHPRDARKWLICRPGFVIGGDKEGNPYIKAVGDNPDNSSVEIQGWQTSENEARVFKFANVGRDEGIVAETLGVTDDIGLISVYFFGEKLTGDRSLPGMAAAPGGQPPKPTLGTAAGREIASRTQAVKVELHKKPFHQIHILYRLESDCPIPAKNRVELDSAAQENTGRLRRR
ncbi:MAG: hypothetical protein U1A77_16010 [Pirellulales bacterium]